MAKYERMYGLAAPYEDYPGYYLKAYTQGTTTPINIATDADGGTLIAKAEVSSGGTPPIGFLQTAGGAILIPHLNETFDAWLFPTSAEADANDTTNAIQVADNILTQSSTANIFYAEFYTDFAAAVTAASGKELVISTNLVISANITVSDVVLRFVQGGNLDPNVGVTVTLNTQIIAGRWEIFDSTAAGTIAGSPQVEGIFPEWFGAVGDGVTDDQAAIQDSQTLSEISGLPVLFGAAMYSVQSTITSSANKGLYWYGVSGGQLDHIIYDPSGIIFTGEASDDSMVEMGNNTHLRLKSMTFSTSDGTQFWNIFKSGTQNSAAGNFLIEDVTLKAIGGRGLYLGGGLTDVEWYGSIIRLYHQGVAQWLNVDGNGEISMLDIHGLTQNTTASLPAAQDAWCYMRQAYVKFNGGLVLANTDNTRNWFTFDDCFEISFSSSITLERNGNTLPTKHLIEVTGSGANLLKMASFEKINFVESDVTSAPTGFLIKTSGTQSIQHMRFMGNSFTSAAGAALNNVPFIDLTDNMPVDVEIGENYHTPPNRPVFKVADPQASNSNTSALGGFYGSAFEYYEIQYPPFTIGATGTNEVAAVRTGGPTADTPIDVLYKTLAAQGEVAQNFPISLQIYSDLSTTETVSFQLLSDQTDDDDVINMSGTTTGRIFFPLRAQYDKTITPSFDTEEKLIYTSSGASTSRLYYVTFTYAKLRVRHGVTDSEGIIRVAN